MTEKGYNGWTNYETWNLALWLDNEGSQDEWRERAQQAYHWAEADKSFTQLERATLNLSEILKDDIEEGMPVLTGFYADILNAAISEVDWYEIASYLLDDVDMTEDN